MTVTWSKKNKKQDNNDNVMYIDIVSLWLMFPALFISPLVSASGFTTWTKPQCLDSWAEGGRGRRLLRPSYSSRADQHVSRASPEPNWSCYGKKEEKKRKHIYLIIYQISIGVYQYWETERYLTALFLGAEQSRAVWPRPHLWITNPMRPPHL